MIEYFITHFAHKRLFPLFPLSPLYRAKTYFIQHSSHIDRIMAKYGSILLCAVSCVGTTEFDRFVETFSKTYPSSSSADEARTHFAASMQEAEEMTSYNPYASFAVNSLFDWSDEEFTALLQDPTQFSPEKSEQIDTNLQAGDMFTSNQVSRALKLTKGEIDYRSTRVTSIRTQGKCSSGYAHAVVATLEAHRVLGGWPLEELSVAQLLECSAMNQGCTGGTPREALTDASVKRLHSVVAYPWMGSVGACRLKAMKGKKARGIAGVQGVGDITKKEPQMLAFLAEYGAFVVGVCGEYLKTYAKGIISECRCKAASHYVAIVGSGVEDGVRYGAFI